MASDPGVTAPDFRTLFESAPGLYLVLDPDFRIVAVSDAYLRATMTSREAILGRGIFDVFPDNPDDPGATGVRNLRESLHRALATGRADAMAVQKYDIRRPESEGGGFEERYWSPVNSPVPGPGGAPRYIIHRVEDVTGFVRLKQAGAEHERLTEELRNRAGRMEMEIYQRAQQLAEANRRLREVNDQQARLYSRIALLMAQADDELRVKESPRDTSDFLENTIAPEEMLARVGKLIAGYRQLEEQLVQSQKMEAIGRLAGGVAHDFNNLLTVITGYASLTQLGLPDGPARRHVDEIQKAADRAAALTARLLAFSRKQVRQVRLLDLNTIVGGIEEMARRLIGENIRFTTRPAASPATVKADRGQLEQVIMNLIVNARDAMPSGGELAVETANARLGAGEINSLPAGDYVLLRVADTGCGMDTETARRIFEPFFTTKPLGKGTGLGLSTVYGIAEQSGGAVTVESAPGEGAVFRVYLPVADGAAVEPLLTPAKARVKEHKGSVLLVEDEEPLRRLVHKVLTDAGYHVLDAASGEAALALVERHAGKVDLLLSDVVMAGMTGVELAERLHALRGGIEVLFMSGYDRELMDREKLDRTSLLPKPFAPAALLERVAEVLGAAARRRGDR
jgi:signal transduction histidine kinase